MRHSPQTQADLPEFQKESRKGVCNNPPPKKRDKLLLPFRTYEERVIQNALDTLNLKLSFKARCGSAEISGNFISKGIIRNFPKYLEYENEIKNSPVFKNGKSTSHKFIKSLAEKSVCMTNDIFRIFSALY
jgi:hypothetical protein